MTDSLEKIFSFYEKSFNLTDVKERMKALLDLSDNEINLYMILLINNSLTANELSKITNIQRTRIYEISRRLKEKELVNILSENPQRYRAVSPRIAIDNWIYKSRKFLEEKSSMLMTLLPTLQMIWSDQHEELSISRISLISESFIREIIPREIKLARHKLCLALRDPKVEYQQMSKKLMFERLFDPDSFPNGIQSVLKKGVLLHILVGDSELFLEKSHPMMLRTLANGLQEGTIELKALNSPFPQSFLLVDDERVFLFFLNAHNDLYSEAIRAENRSLREFFRLIWQNFWEDAIIISVEKVLERLESVKRSE